MEMVLASMDLWKIVNGSVEAPPSNVDPKVIKEYHMHAKKAMSIIGINLVDSQLHHIKRCKGPAEPWKTFATSTRCGACPTSFSFTTSSSRARCKRERTF
jgi:hypothetical protein